jgi:diaminopimelate decarboxylase
VGLHQHIGSNLKKKDKDLFIETSKFIFQIAKLFPDVKHINIGGGMGVKYRK